MRRNFPDGNIVLQQDGAPAHTSKKTHVFLRSHMDFWAKDMWPPYSTDTNPLDFAFWPHIEAKACYKRHTNVEALKVVINQQWEAVDMDYIKKSYEAFRRCL